MTYEESYKKTKTLEELRQEVNSDIATALIIRGLAYERENS